MTNPDLSATKIPLTHWSRSMADSALLRVESGGAKYKQEPASELSRDGTCPGCVADNDTALCFALSRNGCYDSEQRELIWLKVEE